MRLTESAHDNGHRMIVRLRDFEAKDLSLTQFFEFDTETFSLLVNLLDSPVQNDVTAQTSWVCWSELLLFSCKINRRGKQCPIDS